jgi:signal transduction histidine kinase/ActR/RegA family two-component response regulator
MKIFDTLRRGRFPLLVLASLGALLLCALAVGVFSERSLKEQLAREAGAQADLLASAVSGALAFDDRSAAQDYVDAVQVNPSVVSAAVYDVRNRRVAGFVRSGEAPPPLPALADRLGTTVFEGDHLVVVRPVEQGGQRLGFAVLRVLNAPPSQVFSRYAGLLLVLGLAVLVVAVLGFAQDALRRANRSLAERAAALSQSNALLEHQMVEREKAEEALRQSQKMEAIGRLTGGVAHDFNNLLMVASSGIELMERARTVERRRALAEGVRQAIDRGAALTRQLLAFSRRAPLKTEAIDLGARLGGLRLLLERSLREDIEVAFELAPDLWPIEADPGEFELALLNLAVNARDAMPRGGRLVISATNRPGQDDDGDHVILTVRDNGLGISEAVLSRVFEPFFTTKEVGRGTGLGLSQVYGFARSSGGSIAVDSTEGEGTTFTLVLPRSAGGVEPAAALSADPAAPARGDGLRILLVEDDDAVAAGVGHMLRDLGYAYVRSADARSALIALSAEEFDMVFSDMIMPGDMDGLALAKAVRARWPLLPILLTTGFSAAASTAEAEHFPLLHKPYRIADLASALARALDGGDSSPES